MLLQNPFLQDREITTALRELRRALVVMQRLNYMSTDRNGQVRVPSCHGVARAYGTVFDMHVVDGELTYTNETTLCPPTFFRREPSIKISPTIIKHSWIEFDEEDNTFILDIFPERKVSLFPLVHLRPHPGYYVPNEEKRRTLFAAKQAEKGYHEEVSYYIEAMQKIAAAENLKSPA